MTPSRAKRNSKIPNRFNSDNSRIRTSNSNGETILDYNDNSTSTTHALAPMSRTIKLNPAREPLKVKLPKRPHLQSSIKEPTHLKGNTAEIKIHKIKLPSLASRRAANNNAPTEINVASSKTKAVSNGQGVGGTHKETKLESSSNTYDSHRASTTGVAAASPSSFDLRANSMISTFNKAIGSSANSKCKSPPNSNKLSISKLSDGDKLSSADTSMSSEDGGAETEAARMEIVVSPPASANDAGIRCPCEVDDDLGVMVECERCSTWQHGHCINVGTEDEAYEGYICAYCTLPQDKVHESLRQLTVGDKFQSRFDALESLIRQRDSLSHDKQYGFGDAHLGTNIKFTVVELSQATKELKRVLNSLRVKWGILTSQAYELELRIWQNPHWSDDAEANSAIEKSFYFMDRCKSNLKLNIRNMVNRIQQRCQLIEQAISIANSEDTNTVNAMQQAIRLTLEEVAQATKDFKNKLKNLSA